MNTELQDNRPVYSEVMEDYLPISQALSLKPNDVLVVVASAGDNVFNPALEKVSHIFGVDINPQQIEFCRLKESAIKELSWLDFMNLMGIFDSSVVERTYLLKKVAVADDLKTYIEPESLNQLCSHGLAFSSHLDLFLTPLREKLLAFVGENNMLKILTEKDFDARQVLWQKHFESPTVINILEEYLNEGTISGAFIPKWAFTKMKERPFHIFFHKVIKRQLVESNPCDNYFMHHILLGRFIGTHSLPPYLQKDNYKRLQERLSCITWHFGDMFDFLKTLPSASVNAINLSNILDWCDDGHYQILWEQINRVTAPGARVLLRSFLLNRDIPSTIGTSWQLNINKSALMNNDRVGYYSRYELWVRL